MRRNNAAVTRTACAGSITDFWHCCCIVADEHVKTNQNRDDDASDGMGRDMEIMFRHVAGTVAAGLLALLIPANASAGQSPPPAIQALQSQTRLQYPISNGVLPADTARLRDLPAASMPFPDLVAMNHALGAPLDACRQATPLIDPQAASHDQAAVPLPSGATTGAIVLALLGLVAARKPIFHFFK